MWSKFFNLVGGLHRTKKFFLVSLIISSSWVLVYYYTLQHHQAKEKVKSSSNRLKILLWLAPKSKITKDHFWRVHELERSGHCQDRCEVFDDPNLIDFADAVVAHGNQKKEENDPLLPPQKKLNQIRILFRTEAPGSFFDDQLENAFWLPNQYGYNWTFTYRLDSDVPAPSGQYRLIQNGSSNSAGKIEAATMDPSFLAGKTKLVAWIVSHCPTMGGREQLVEKMKQFLPIDVYGACGSLKCPGGLDQWNNEDCHEALGKQYKFYLAFENKLCTDYVTEKFFRALKFGMIPIVYGGANYSLHAPPGSFIDSMAFSTIQELATYIKFLDQNPQEYLKYFEWTKYYEIFKGHWWCDLCDKLWKHSIVDKWGKRVIDPSYHKSYPDMASWFNYKPARNGEKRSKVPACGLPPNFQ